MSRPVAHRALNEATADRAAPTRDWFLCNSTWTDACWTLAPTSALEEERPVLLRWDFKLAGGDRFTDRAYARLLESSRRVIALIRSRSLTTGLPQRATTARVYFIRLRMLLHWMIEEGFTRFADLDEIALQRYRHHVASRRGRSSRLLTPAGQELSIRVLVYLHRHRAELGDGLTVDPCPGQCAHALAGASRALGGSLPYTPDLVAVPLIQGAIDFLETSAIDILCARERYIKACQRALPRGLPWDDYREQVLHAVQIRTIHLAGRSKVIDDLVELSTLIRLMYSACFVVISYLVGSRVSEILALRAGCTRPMAPDENRGRGELAVIVGSIFKQESGYYGRTHEWVAPPPAIHAISVLEALSEPHRRRSRRPQLWLRTRVHRRGFFEWRPDSVAPLRVSRTERIYLGLARLATWLRLPDHEGQPWPLSTHQGRKTFARFVALRDRTGLFALAQHLGHRDRRMTDKGYVGNDYALQEEIEEHILEQSVSAWEQMLSAPTLGGRAGAHIMAKRPRFRGLKMKQDLRSFAQLLVQAGLTLGVCDWGFCVYRQEHSACLGSATEPNPIYREPSTCVRCRNYVVTEQHRSYWQEQVERHQALLNEPDLPRQTLKIARDRLTEATKVLRSITVSCGRG
jgi:integrase